MPSQRPLRNIGISAHIDSGKTTLTERILYYTDKIHAMHEVKGKDGVGAAMDSMALEKERGITIQSAATNTQWRGVDINVIDTPGHVDFTIEVERALRVLDGAVMVLCAVGGVQSQSFTVDRQMKRYNVPRLAFINKCDRAGANPDNVVSQIRDQLGLNAVLLTLPIGLEDKLTGVVDLIEMKALYFEGTSGETVRESDIPADLVEIAQARREILLDAASLCCDDLTKSLLANSVTPDLVRQAIRKGVIALSFVPVLAGSAFKNKGVQPLLDAVVDFLPSPGDGTDMARDLDNQDKEVALIASSQHPTVAHAFKLEDGRYGQLTYIRLYQGSISKGMTLRNTRTQREIRVGRLVRMHASTMEEIYEAHAGDIVALFGIECASGDTFASHGLNVAMTSMYVPEPVISISVKAADRKENDGLSKAIGRFAREDATFRSFVDPESKQTIIQGMGELHLDVYLTRIQREYGITVKTGRPQVAYRESITKRIAFNYTHKKQTGGAGQFARVAGFIEPSSDGEYAFLNETKGGAIPKDYIGSCDKGFQECMARGDLIGFPVTGVCVTIDDGAAHSVDSSDVAFRQAAIGAFRGVYGRAAPVILEPVMKVSVEGPDDFQGPMLASLNQRRGTIAGLTDNGTFVRVDGFVPLSEMFGYSTALRSATQGKAEFSMEFARYEKVPVAISDELKKEYADRARHKGP